MNKQEIQDFSIDQLLEAISFRYGYDFRNYSRASLERRILNRIAVSELGSVSDMIPKIMHDPLFFELFLKDLSITVTEMFRDPYVFKKLREQVCGHLKTYPRINIWHAGCSTGEEVYSTAIIMEEEGLLQRVQIYATDFNNHSLAIASDGIYPADKVPQFTKNYQASGGTASFADYYQAKYGSAKMKESLKEKITFANHNLVSDECFAEMHLIVCRNVLIYFNNQLQDRVLNLFVNSLVPRGFILLGNKETVDFTSVTSALDVFSGKERIYRKRLSSV